MRNKLFGVLMLACFASSAVYASGAVGIADQCQFTFEGNVGSRSWSLADAAHAECRVNESLTVAGRQNESRMDAYRMWQDYQPTRIIIQHR